MLDLKRITSMVFLLLTFNFRLGDYFLSWAKDFSMRSPFKRGWVSQRPVDKSLITAHRIAKKNIGDD